MKSRLIKIAVITALITQGFIECAIASQNRTLFPQAYTAVAYTDTGTYPYYIFWKNTDGECVLEKKATSSATEST